MPDFAAIEDLAPLVRDGIRHIEKCQQPDGSFLSLSSFSQTDFTSAVPYRTTFFTSIILACTNSVSNLYKFDIEDALVIYKVRERAAQFLMAEKSERWSWNYWARGTRERKTMPYPDDLDDAFTALIALKGFNPEVISTGTLAAIVKLLTSAETKEGGPYRTWLLGADADPHWKDIDPVVNSNIAYFLSFFEISLHNIEKLIDDAIRESRLRSPYYPGTLQVAYFISRFYCGPQKAKLMEWLLEAVSDSDDGRNQLEQALAISALTHLHAKPASFTTAVSRLMTTINKNGWCPYAFCIDPTRESKTCYAGSSALTAALCLEALVGYSNALQKNELAKYGAVEIPVSSHKKILTMAESDCANLGGELQSIAIGEIEKITDEKITSLARGFQLALGESGKIIPPVIIDQLAIANLYGWIAYEIYDDFLDAEGNPLLLSCANFFLRRLTGIYAMLDHTIPGAWNLFQTVVNVLDNANVWEQKHCRFPTAALPSFNNYENLADRSFGYFLGPLTELLTIGHPPQSPEYKHITRFFRYYLIARQLHDDAHDWAHDLQQGRVNSVASLILEEFQQASQQTLQLKLASLPEVLPNLRHLFWTKTIEHIAQQITKNINGARNARNRSILIRKTNFMESELVALEIAMKHAVKERDDMLEFLKYYGYRDSESYFSAL